MPGTMLVQTKRVIEAVKSCGFARSEFSAQTPFDRSYMGYGMTKVTFKSEEAKKKAVEKAKELAATGELNVVLYRLKEFAWVTVEESVLGGSYREHDIEATQKYIESL